ncbi:FAD-dependent oxidoreductase [Candidatus Poribacteria bacterium]|nr:FAD-dependent oxidoreductase [Candidatus Poribacteria bacterium]
MTDKIYDIAVYGGGMGGFAAALEAASLHKNVLLVERRPALGWESTWACQLDLGEHESSIVEKIKSELKSAGGIKDDTADAPILEMVLNKLAKDAGVSVLLYSYPIRLIYENDLAYGVVVGNKSGEQIIKSKTIVDATNQQILWNQTGDIPRKSESRGKHVIYFNNVNENMDLPLDAGNGVRVLPSVWDGEVRVEYTIEKCDTLLAVSKMPEIVEYVRKEVPRLRDAMVSHAGNEPAPFENVGKFHIDSPRHSTLKNLFRISLYASRDENIASLRLKTGEITGTIASECEGVKEFPEDMMTGSYIEEPVVSCDVLVVGGGTAGSIAAIASGREGVKTTLIEASPCLGGIGTGGAIHSYYHGVRGGIQDEMDQRIKDMTPLFAGKWKVRGFHPLIKKIILQDMTIDAGVDILLNTTVTGALCKDGTSGEEKATTTSIAVSEGREKRNQITSVIAVNSGGIADYNAKVFIDSTGDGDLAVMAGAPFVIGREKDNLPHAYSQSSGRLDKDGTLGHNNFDAGYVDPSDITDLTRARRLGVSQYWRDKFTKDNRILYLAPIIGLRQSRQIMGEYVLTLADEIAGRRFEDAISFTIAHYDNHHHDYENESDEATLWVWALGNWSQRIGCEVPYRCLIPQRVDGLILACRALSISYDAHMEFRMQNDMQRIGEVAGIAAALAVKNGVNPRRIDVNKLQEIIRQKGLLDEEHRPDVAIPERKVLELPSSEELDSQKTKELVWLSSQGSKEDALALKDMLNSDDPQVRFRASAALAWHGLDEGIPELLKTVEDRVTTETEGRRNVPFWQAAIPFLGMARDEKAVPALVDVLKDKEANLDALTGAVIALGRIGDKSVIPDLKEFLQRKDLPTTRVMNSGWGTTDDALWQIELTVAETLSKLGSEGDEIRDIVKPHLDDERAYVRRYANKVLPE